MKHVRTFLFLLVAGLMLSGSAWAQGDLSLGGGGDDLSAGIVSATFSGSASMTVELIHPYHIDTHADSIYLAATTGDTIRTVSARTDAARVYKFHIANLTASQDTLRAITVASFNDEPYMFENIYLYRSDDTLHTGGTKIAEVLDLGSLTDFAENTTLAFTGLNDTIPAGDTVFYWFEVDIDSASVDATWNDEFAGLKIFQNGIELASNGFAPTGVTDTLRYNASGTWPHTYEDQSTLHAGDGRVLVFDTKPPEVTIDFDLAADNDSCGGNGMVNLGDSVFIIAWDTVDVFEIYKAYAQIEVFGGGAAQAFTDTIAVGADSGMTLGWKLPETSITPPLDVASGFWYLIVTVEDEPGNQLVDSLLVQYAIDNQKPLFDGDSVWVELVYDANGDGIAATGDTVQVFAYMTTNPYDEVDSVWADMTNWGYSDTIILDDAAGDRRFTRRLGLANGTIDIGADSSDSRFWVWAYDNACNWNVDSALAHFAIDNDPPDCPLVAAYTRDLDLDSNNIINIGDNVAFEIDASNTPDLASTCPVSLDLMNSGLGGLQVQCVEDTNSSGNYIYTWTVADGGFFAVDVAPNVHDVPVILTDDAGNKDTCNTTTMPFRVDTDPPEPVTMLTPYQGPCAIMLHWSPSNSDDSLYLVFWDGGDGVWDTADSINAVGSSNDTIWTTDGTVIVQHGLTYQFFVRTIDDANNTEYNFTKVAMIADCEAPDVCIDYPATSGAYGVFNSLALNVSTQDGDAAACSLYVRDQDAGTGTPGPWMFYDLMSQVAGGQQFVDTIDQTGMTSLFSYPPNRNVYDVMTVGIDTLGNGQTWTEALAACPAFEFTWFYVGLAPYLVSVNGAVSAQTGCGFDITLDTMNLVEIDVPSYVPGDTFTVDVFVNTLDDPNQRVNYYEGVDAMPFQFYLNATNFEKGTNTVWVRVTRNDQNTGTFTFSVCAPDTVAPSASIIYPTDGQRVRKMNSVLRPLNVWARVNDWAYDPSPVTRVDFEHALLSDYMANGESAFSVFDVQTAPAFGDTFEGNWNNMAFVDGDTVIIRAVFYDNLNNYQATPYVTVVLDGSATDIVLTCQQAVDVNGIPTIAGVVDFYAEIQESYNDFANLKLYVRKTTDPDVFANYTLIGQMGPATDEGVYVYYGYNTAGLMSNVNWDFRVIATDITGNVMFDYDDDGVFDDNTFDPTSSNHHSDKTWFVDNTAAPIAFSQFEANGITFYTPSTKLSGTGMVYAQARADMTVWSQTIPMSDTIEVAGIRYGWLPANPGTITWVAQGAADPWYTATFNPYTLGLYTDDDIMNRYITAWLVVEKTDVLNRPVTRDTIQVTILDVDPNQAVITSLLWQNYYWGNISLTAGALNSYNMYSVTYQYATEGAPTTWHDIATSYNVGGSFPATWQTLGAVADGWVWVRAVLTDSSFNVDQNPVATKIFIANELPNASLQSVTLPSGAAVADSGFIGHNTIFTASASHDNPDIPIDSVQFMYKNVLSGTWQTWSTDYYPPYNAQWTNSITSDGSFHYRVRAYNRAGRYVDSDYWTLYNDETNPTIAATKICDQDVEANNDPSLDLNACMPVADLYAMFQDNGSWSGANSGIVKVAFELRNNSGTSMYYQTVDPATDGEQTSSFNISGLPEGTYRFYFYAWDLVGNKTTFGPVYGYITDQTPPVTSVIGYYGNRLYGYDWSGDATEVLFQYQDGEAWIGIGTGNTTTTGVNTSAVGVGNNFWWTEFDASSITGTHNFRMLASDGTNSNEATAIQISATADGNGGLTFAAGELTDLVIMKNYQNDNSQGVLRVTAPSGNEPVALAVYQEDFDDPPNFNYEFVDLNPNTPGGTLFQEDVHPYSYVCGGYSIFFVGSADGTGAVNTMVRTYTYWDDLPSTYTGIDDKVTVNLPDGDHDGCMIMMETWLPKSGEPQDDWVPVANHNGGTYANYIGCADFYGTSPKADGGGDQSLSSYCCFDDNHYAQVTMSYDPSITVPADSLTVLRWDPDYSVWKSDGIYKLRDDAWFDTENHTVQFSTDCLYGVYAVAQQIDEPAGNVNIEFYDAYPWCTSDGESYYTSPTQEGSMPKFVFHVSTHEFADIDDDEFVVKIDGIKIHDKGYDAFKTSVCWDDVSGLLAIYMTDDCNDEYEYDDEYSAPPLDCGTHTLYIEAKNNQGAWNSLTWTFNVDCTPPEVVFDNYYVSKNPTITFSLSDAESGIDWEKVFVDVVAIETNDTNSARPNQDDNCFFLGTFFPGQVGYYYDDETGTVSITTHYELEDERAIAVAIYDGERSDYSYYYSTGDPVTYGEWDEFYLEDHGIHDCVSNPADPWFQILAVDYDGPVILAQGETRNSKLDALPNDCPTVITIADDGSGVKEVFVYEDDILISEASGDLEPGSYKTDVLQNGDLSLRYCKTPGTRTRIVANDNVGNPRERIWSAFGDDEYTDAGEPYNYPNPFDPSQGERTLIVSGFEGNGIAVKIYDFGGEEVIELNANSAGQVYWNGMTTDGVRVANGVYFAYCTTQDGQHKVVKIAVISK